MCTVNCGKLDIVKLEMERNKVNLLGISTLKWIGRKHLCSNKHHVYFSGNETKRQNGIAIIFEKSMHKTILGDNPISERLITIKLQGHSMNMTSFQVYAPTGTADPEETECFYAELQTLIDKVPGHDILIN